MPRPPRAKPGRQAKSGDGSHSSQKPLQEEHQTPPQESKKSKAKKGSQRLPLPTDHLRSQLRPLSFPPPGQGGMSGSSDTSGDMPQSELLASYPPRYIHKSLDSEANASKGYISHGPGRQPQMELTCGSKSLWVNPTGWDLRVVCRDGSWVVHQELLKREAPGFFDIVTKIAMTDGTLKNGKDVPTVDLSAWHPGIIGGLLMFLYTGDWPDMDGHPPGPTNLRAVQFHVHMAAQAWTLDFPTNVREAAVFKINRATYRLNNSIMSVLSNYPLIEQGYAGVEEPLYMALDFLYRQDRPQVMKYLMPVRAAIARLVDIALPWLLKQPGFVTRFQTLWSQEPVYSRYMGDHHKFFELGCLLPSWDNPPESLEPEAESTPSGDEVIEEAVDKE